LTANLDALAVRSEAISSISSLRRAMTAAARRLPISSTRGVSWWRINRRRGMLDNRGETVSDTSDALRKCSRI
jgi:hypothetical protein